MSSDNSITINEFHHCYICSSSTGVKDLVFRNRNDSISIPLCSACRRVLKEKLISLERLEDSQSASCIINGAPCSKCIPDYKHCCSRVVVIKKG